MGEVPGVRVGAGFVEWSKGGAGLEVRAFVAAE